MGQITVSNVSIRLYDAGDEKLRGFASIVINDAFVVKDLKIIEGSAGWFVAMPSRKGKDGYFYDIAHPLNPETRRLIERKVLEEYHKEAQAAREAEGEDITFRLDDIDAG